MGSGTSRAETMTTPVQRLSNYLGVVEQDFQTAVEMRRPSAIKRAEAEFARVLQQIKELIINDLGIPDGQTYENEVPRIAAKIKLLLDSSPHPVVEEWLRGLRSELHMRVAKHYLRPIAGTKVNLPNFDRRLMPKIPETTYRSMTTKRRRRRWIV